MNGWGIALSIVFLMMFAAWLFWFAWKGERERFEQMRRKGNRSSTYLDKFWEDKNGKDRARHP